MKCTKKGLNEIESTYYMTVDSGIRQQTCKHLKSGYKLSVCWCNRCLRYLGPFDTYTTHTKLKWVEGSTMWRPKIDMRQHISSPRWFLSPYFFKYLGPNQASFKALWFKYWRPFCCVTVWRFKPPNHNAEVAAESRELWKTHTSDPRWNLIIPIMWRDLTERFEKSRSPILQHSLLRTRLAMLWQEFILISTVKFMQTFWMCIKWCCCQQWQQFNIECLPCILINIRVLLWLSLAFTEYNRDGVANSFLGTSLSVHIFWGCTC